ncbi:MAG: hypothetical protein KKC90_15775 [Alphaproteobacteria bacterium]|nr:hypothetical protein [Alphaproteobacteria bacterium]MBU1789032.1 hypothetical protein [Alphaproteobacteria bacterium]MBU2105432.1 hypothetical protein [Alphaproteobacteria bacterium]
MNAPVRAAAEGMPTKSPERDPVFDIAVQLGRAERSREELDLRAVRDRPNRYVFAGQAQNEQDRVDTLRAAISQHKATSLEGAAVQIAEALVVADFLNEWVREDALDGSEVSHAQRDYRALQRLLFSALDVVEAATGRKMADLGLQAFRNPSLSPWVQADDKLKAMNTVGLSNARYEERI